MLLTMDVGNTQINCGVYEGEDLKATFRRTSTIRASSDEFGVFFRTTLRENVIDLPVGQAFWPADPASAGSSRADARQQQKTPDCRQPER